jgi:hypothetical protein
VKLGGARPGSKKLTPAARLKGSRAGAAARQAKANDGYSDLYAVALKLRGEGKTLDGIASSLNGEGYTTTTGKPWGKVQVARLLAYSGPRKLDHQLS